MPDLCLMFAALIAVVALAFLTVFAYAWWADYDPLLLGDFDMAAKLQGAELSKAKADLKAAGCPDDVCDRMVSAGVPLALIQRLIAFALAHGGEIWALVSELLALVPAAP